MGFTGVTGSVRGWCMMVLGCDSGCSFACACHPKPPSVVVLCLWPKSGSAPRNPARPPPPSAQQQHPKICCRKSQTILRQFCKVSYHRNPTPPPADIPILNEKWLPNPQSEDPKETRNPLPFLMLLKSSKKKRKKMGGATQETLKPFPHVALFQVPQYTHT